MKTKIKFRFVNFLGKVTSLALFFILLAPSVIFAQTGAPLDCDPLPEDITLLEECISIIGTTPGTGTASELISAPGGGGYGMSAGYNPTNNTILYVASTAGGVSIVGQLYDGKTMTAAGGSFIIDQWSLFVGANEVIYNPVTNNFLVVWFASHTNTSPYIHGRFINADGSMPSGEFTIAGPGSGANLSLDTKNSRYVINYDAIPYGPRMVTVGFDGKVGEVTNLARKPGVYEGQSDMAYNSNLNEYWYVYVSTLSGSDTAEEDDRIMFARVDASSNQAIGDPIQLK